jgi:hypothetical protein
VKGIVLSYLSEIEAKINTDLAQKSIDEKVKSLRADKSLPFLVRKCITKYTVITAIEKSMNIVSDVCELNKEFDLNGNDDIVLDKILGGEYGVSAKEDGAIESDSYVYAEAAVRTDFRGSSSGQVSVGIKKKI